MMKAGFVQYHPEFGNVQANLDRVEELLAGKEADLFVLPELFSTGYRFKNMEEAHHYAELVPGGLTTGFLCSMAKKMNAYFIAGLVETENGRIYNSSVIVGPEGFLGRYRKIHLFDTEKACFHTGREAPPVFDLRGAKVGVMICFDWRFPETARSLALKGAEIIAHPSNLVLPHCPQAMITRCLENRVFAITADRVGDENRVPNETLHFIGQSQVVDPDGNVLVRASETGEEVCVVEIELEKAREKVLNPKNDIFKDRRPDLYF
ncbi:MAG: acyltransferase [Nitrospinae bacterium]|nr:acyltransferase [Nitrospinota bacterium]